MRWLAIAGAVMLAAPAHADLQVPQLTDQELTNIVAKFRAYLPRARLPDGSPIAPETPAELALPIVPNDVARAVIRRGSVSGMLEACSGDWSGRSFLPMMTQARARGDLQPKQLAFIGLLHGVFQGAVNTAAPKTACDATLIAKIDAELGQPAF